MVTEIVTTLSQTQSILNSINTTIKRALYDDREIPLESVCHGFKMRLMQIWSNTVKRSTKMRYPGEQQAATQAKLKHISPFAIKMYVIEGSIVDILNSMMSELDKYSVPPDVCSTHLIGCSYGYII